MTMDTTGVQPTDIAAAVEVHSDAHLPGGLQPLDDTYATKTYLTTAAQALIDAIVPIGTIMLWSGAVATIPTHWHLCDGNSGTVNLKDVFVYGAGGSVSPLAGGGSATQADHAHHNHPYTNANFIAAGAGLAVNPNIAIGAESPTLTHGTNLPPYIALAYIQRIS